MAPITVEELENVFGGLRPAAKALGVPPATFAGWKRRGAIPEWRKPQIESVLIRRESFNDVSAK